MTNVRVHLFTFELSRHVGKLDFILIYFVLPLAARQFSMMNVCVCVGEWHWVALGCAWLIHLHSSSTIKVSRLLWTRLAAAHHCARNSLKEAAAFTAQVFGRTAVVERAWMWGISLFSSPTIDNDFMVLRGRSWHLSFTNGLYIYIYIYIRANPLTNRQVVEALSLSLSLSFSLPPSPCLSPCLSLWLSIIISTYYLSIYLRIYLSIHPFISVSVYLSP